MLVGSKKEEKDPHHLATVHVGPTYSRFQLGGTLQGPKKQVS